MRIRHKKSQIEAVQWNGVNIDEVMAITPSGRVEWYDGEFPPVTLSVNLGSMTPVPVGSWVVRDRERGPSVYTSEEFDALFETES